MKLSAKFRVKNGVPFSIEKLQGTFFRCGVCGKTYNTRKEIEKHLKNEKPGSDTKLKFPELFSNVSVNVLYIRDIRDVTNSKFPKLNKGDKFYNIQKGDE